MARIKLDTYIGMGFSNLIVFFIMLTTAATVHAHGVTDIQTSAQAAEALRPIAGRFAFLPFSMGIIGTGLLAVPVLAGSAAFAVTESFRWRRGLDLSAPIMIVMMRMASNPEIMGAFVVTRRLRILGRAATMVMAVAVAAMVIQMLS